MLQNSTVTAFTVSKLLRENQLGGVKLLSPPHPPPSRVNKAFYRYHAVSAIEILKYLNHTNVTSPYSYSYPIHLNPPLPPNFIVFTESIISLKLNYSEMQKDWPIICFHLWKHILGVT